MDFNSAKEKFENSLYEAAFREFSELALEFRLLDELSDQVRQCMQMAVASYKKIEQAAPLPQEYSLLDQFYFAVRHYMDDKSEEDPVKVADEIFREIPLGIPDERIYIFPEGNRTYEEKKAGTYKTAAMSAQGPREEMEDEHLVTEITLYNGSLPMPFFGVFDGHGGMACSYFIKQKLPQMLEQALEKTNLNSDLEIYNTLRKVFVRLDKAWAQLPFQKTDNQDFSG